MIEAGKIIEPDNCNHDRKIIIITFCFLIGSKLSNGHSPQIRQNGELLVRMCRGESHFCSILAKFAGANVSSPG
jgi:hypothetical protein